MSTDHDDDGDDAPVLPERDVLERWRVPQPSGELAERVLARVEAALPVLPVARRSKTLGVVVVGVAMAAAAALVLGLAQSWRRPPAAEPTPAAVAAPASDAEPAPPGSVREETPVRSVPAFEPAAPVVPPVSSDAATKPGAKPPPPKPDDEAELATLRIGTTQGSAPATILIDGERVGMTPLKAASVTPGRHEVRWEWDDGTSASLTIDVGAGAVLTLKNPAPSTAAPAKPAKAPAPPSTPGFDDPFAGRGDPPPSGGSSPGLKDPFRPAE